MKNNPPALEPLLIRAKQAAAICGVSPRKWADLQASGQIPPSFKLGGCRVWKISDISFWVERDMPSLDAFLKMRGTGR